MTDPRAPRGPQLPGAAPRPAPPDASRHPLLGLTPAARRELARTLIRGLHAHRAGERTETRRAGVRGLAVMGGAGAALGAAWVGLAGGALAPFAGAYLVAMALQAVAGRALAGDDAEGDPGWARAARAFALAPYDATRAAKDLLAPERVSPDRMVLAAGLLVAVRHPLSSSLLRRLVGRAYPLAEVDRAIALLVRMGHVAHAPSAPGVLVLTPAGVGVLKSLGVPPPEARRRGDPDIAPHLRPIFAALDARGRTAGRVAPDVMVRPVAVPEPPAPEPPPEPEPEAEPQAPPRPDNVVPFPARPPVVPASPVELPRPGRHTAPIAATAEPPPVVGPAPARPARRLPVPLLAGAVMVAALGVLATLFPFRLPAGPRERVVATAEAMPHSSGTALQFNGRGFLLSSFGGDLFLSIPERLDYKRPLSFQGFDMAADCGLVDRDVRAARMAPMGRFLWAELGGEGDGKERCLVDLETKTVTHDLPSRQPAYGLAHVVGWAGPQTLLMAAQAPPARAGRWWAVDVVTHAAAPVDLPAHQKALPLATEGGPALLAGFDARGGGAWDLTTYWLGDGRAYQKVRTIRTTMPDDLRDAEPHHAALSPDKRYLLVALTAADAGLPAGAGALAVISLEDGTVTRLGASPAPLVDAPMFWGPEVREGRYRFYFNGPGPDGVVPLAGEMAVTRLR